MKRFLLSICLGFSVALPVLALFSSPPAFAACSGDLSVDNGINCAAPGQQATGDQFKSIWRKVIETIIFLVGAIAVLMVVIGGLMYALSGGDPGGTKKAKDTILFALIGVIVALMAYALVRFIGGRF